MQIYLESLGCARNQVDSEIMQARLTAAGCTFTDHAEQAEVIIVNTCSFIESAADESIDTILALGAYKSRGRCRRLIVAGCLPQRYGQESRGALPEVDLFLGTGAYGQIVSAVLGGMAPGTCLLPDPDTIDLDQPVLPTPSSAHTAYLKIAEGCSRRCTYCIIPKLRGRQKSRRPESIASEARALVDGGVKELILVAQETTAYGRDLPGGPGLDRLLEQLALLAPAAWIRFLYGHPESFQPALLDIVSRFPNICRYFDIPIQHADNRILKRMGRHYACDDLKRLFDTIRNKLPDAVLRTTVLVGFPGETEDDFERLCHFIEETVFDHLGAFAYSDGEDLVSHRLDGHVDPDTARQRVEVLMNRQQEISADNLLTRYLGRRLEVLIESGPEDGLWTGRTQFQAPEVDGQTLIRQNAGDGMLSPGAMVLARVIETTDYDLVAQPLETRHGEWSTKTTDR